MAYPAMNKRLLDQLALLLALDTTSRESNLALIQHIRDYLAQWGISSELFYSDDGRKANLYATLGPAGGGGVMLSGHTDVVPVDGQHWTYPPFQMTYQDGRYYGRGSADMKGFIACVLASVPAFLEQPLSMPLHLAFSYDEEVGCLGVRSMVEHLRGSKEKPALCIVGEPTEMRPVYGHKGKIALRCEIHGQACHSAYAPRGVNAIEYAAKLIGKLGDIRDQLTETQDPRFDPPWSTLQVGTIAGGSALNIVPQDCQFDFELRYLPGADVDALITEVRDYADKQLLPPMQKKAAASAIQFKTLSQYPGLLTDAQSEFAGWLAQWCSNDDYSTVAFGTEGGLFDEAGIATLICGPGSMEQGHKPDEFVSSEQLQQCMAMLENLRQWMSVPTDGV